MIPNGPQKLDDAAEGRADSPLGLAFEEHELGVKADDCVDDPGDIDPFDGGITFDVDEQRLKSPDGLESNLRPDKVDGQAERRPRLDGPERDGDRQKDLSGNQGDRRELRPNRSGNGDRGRWSALAIRLCCTSVRGRNCRPVLTCPCAQQALYTIEFTESLNRDADQIRAFEVGPELRRPDMAGRERNGNIKGHPDTGRAPPRANRPTRQRATGSEQARPARSRT